MLNNEDAPIKQNSKKSQQWTDYGRTKKTPEKPCHTPYGLNAQVHTEYEGKIIGAVFGFSYPWHAGSIFFIQELLVAEQYRGRGIAGDLVRQVVEKNVGNSHVALIVREGTVAAKFYEKLGLSKSTQYEIRSGKLRI